jgi:rhodanese-related sulfurtransferase
MPKNRILSLTPNPNLTLFSSALRQGIVILALALIPAVAAGLWHPKRPAWPSDEVTVATAERWNPLWIDARPAADFARAHVPGALSLNEDQWEVSIGAVLDQWDPNRKVVVYCSSLSCQLSHDVARRLRQDMDMQNVFVLQGGWEAWQRSHPSPP